MTAADGHLRNMDQDIDRLKRLAEFGPIFRDQNNAFGEWRPVTGKGTMEDPLIGGWFDMSESAGRFCDVVNEFIWSLEGFDWVKWIGDPEGQEVSSSLGAIAAADGLQLAKLALSLVRQDRFSEGKLAKAYEDKTLLAIVERAEALVGAPASSPKRAKKSS
jgi:hypothetical protein